MHTVVIYIDFSKAFDVVSHCKLFARLQSYGVNGNLLQWLRNFFTGRTHKTKVCSSLSDQADLVGGVVQGSGIGPIMFIIFINELVEILEVRGIRVNFFADDSKMYAKIIDGFDVVRLQAALDTLTQCAESGNCSYLLTSVACCILVRFVLILVFTSIVMSFQ